MKKILVVEDDEFLAKMQRLTFSSNGYEVEIASDGLKAIELLDDFKPDLVVLDLVLPSIDGVEVIRQIRDHENVGNIPIVVFSNFDLGNLVANAGRSWANYSLTKSNCSRKQLIAVVKEALETSSRKSQEAANPRLTENQHSKLTASPTESSPEALRQIFLSQVPGTISSLRSILPNFIKGEKEDRRNYALDLYLTIHSITQDSTLVGFNEIANFCQAFESLLKELYENPEYINSSTTRTVAQSIDFLPTIMERHRHNFDQFKQLPQGHILIVDDEPIACLTINYALQKARLKTKMVGNPSEALKIAEETQFDLIILDVNMPVMTGFELCTKLRALPLYKKTPVIFVTCMTDLESRAKSALSGGNEFIGKPFLLIELTVKALTYILRNQK